MFTSLQRRITRGYVLLAVVLIFVVVAASTALAFLLYARSLSDSVSGASQRATEAAGAIGSGHTLEQAAPQIIAAVQRSRLHVRVLDQNGRVLAQNEREAPPSPGRGIVIAIGRAIGLPSARIPVPGGQIVINADFDRFGAVLLWYWSIMLPIGLLAVLAAWLIGRRITANAIGPLADVTKALHAIAAGDSAPQRLLNESSDLRELTGAYNDVAYSLATASAEQKQTEAQMRQFIADAGHELRTPLTIIMGYLDVLRKGIVHGSEATERTYDTMLDESRKMRTLIEKLILLARLDRAQTALRPVPIDLCALTQRVATSLEPLAGGRISTDLRDEGAIVTADESELYEAVKNMVDNALKYAPRSEVRLAVTREGDRACVLVADRGPGMDPQDVEHAFDRFYRGEMRSEVEGTGLGLAIAKRAAERAGGDITLSSTPGEGTTVTLCLPCLHTSPAAA